MSAATFKRPADRELTPLERAAARLDDPAERRRFLADHRRAYEFLREAQNIRRRAWARWRTLTGREPGK